MKLLLENWHRYLNEADEPSTTEMIVKKMKELGEKAVASADEEDIRKMTVFWHLNSEEHPEIRDIWAKYMTTASKKLKDINIQRNVST